MPTMKEVAALAGVSVGTVSNVIAELPTVTQDMRDRVNAAVRELDYHPNQIARSLKTRKTWTLGMVVSDIANPFFSDVIRGAEDAAMRLGYTLSIVNSGDNVSHESRVVEILRSRRVDGMLVVVALERNDHSHLRTCLDEGIPIVCLDRVPDGVELDTVSIDNAASTRKAVEHLLAIGHRRIAYLGGSPKMYMAPERQRGYRDAMLEGGCEPLVREGSFSRQSGRDATLELMAGGEAITAVLCGNLQIALGVMQALQQKGLETPRDLSIATFDHFEWLDVFHPRLTAIVQPAYRIGYEGADLLIRRIQGRIEDPSPCHIVLPTELRVAESTAPYPPR